MKRNPFKTALAKTNQLLTRRVLLIILLIVGIYLGLAASTRYFLRGAKEERTQYWDSFSYKGQELHPKNGITPIETIKEAIEDKVLAIVEFDDSGDYFDRFQRIYASGVVGGAKSEVATLYIYIHGWNHSADPAKSNGDLARFAQFMRDLNGTDSPPSHVGVYISWPGDPNLDAKILAPLSFPGRRAATSRVASAALMDCLANLRQVANKEDKLVVLIGHSFGGRVTEHLMAPTAINYYHIRRELKIAEIKGPGDQPKNLRDLLLADITLLVNPATEGLNARKTKLALRKWPYGEFPAIISLTSETDNHTGKTWTMGKVLEEMLIPTVPSQKGEYMTSIGPEPTADYLLHTSGHDRRLLNGRIQMRKEGDLELFDIEPELTPEPLKEDFLFPGNKNDLGHKIASSGYLAFRLSKEILDGHNGEYAAKKRKWWEFLFRKKTEDTTIDLKPTIFNSHMKALIQSVIADYKSFSPTSRLALRRKAHDEKAMEYDVKDDW